MRVFGSLARGEDGEQSDLDLLVTLGAGRSLVQVFGPFDRGEFRELTDQEWQTLIDGERKSPHDPQSLALPLKG